MKYIAKKLFESGEGKLLQQKGDKVEEIVDNGRCLLFREDDNGNHTFLGMASLKDLQNTITRLDQSYITQKEELQARIDAITNIN